MGDRYSNIPGSRSRIKIMPGRGASGLSNAYKTLAELPFTEISPTMGPHSGMVYGYCKNALQRLSPHERDVVLANLLAEFASKP